MVPAAVYVARRHAWFDWLWSLPPYPWSKMAIGAAVALAACLSGLALAPLVARASTRWRGFGALSAVVAVLAAGLACFQWQSTNLSGDSKFWIRMASDPFIMSSEPLGRWFHYLAYEALAGAGIEDRLLAVRVSSVLAGMAYLTGLLVLVPRAFPNSTAWAMVAFLFVAPTSELFAGNPETTPWVYAFTGVYLLAGLRYLEAGPARAPWVESLLLMLTLWTHGMACFATGAHATLIGLWLFRGRDAGADGARSPRRLFTAAGLALLPFAALAATFAWAYHFGTGFPKSPWYGNAFGGGGGLWVAFSETVSYVDVQYIFFDSRHVVDLANLVLLACPLLIALPLAVAGLAGTHGPKLAFLSSALGGLLLFSLFWNADLGIQRDFDLMALFAIPAQLTVALWLDARFSAGQQRLVTLATAGAVFAFRLVPYLRFP